MRSKFPDPGYVSKPVEHRPSTERLCRDSAEEGADDETDSDAEEGDFLTTTALQPDINATPNLDIAETGTGDEGTNGIQGRDGQIVKEVSNEGEKLTDGRSHVEEPGQGDDADDAEETGNVQPQDTDAYDPAQESSDGADDYGKVAREDAERPSCPLPCRTGLRSGGIQGAGGQEASAVACGSSVPAPPAKPKKKVSRKGKDRPAPADENNDSDDEEIADTVVIQSQ